MTMKITGRVIKGHQVASGKATNSPFSAGTIALQKPFFKKLGLDLSEMFNGTINLALEQPNQVSQAAQSVQFGKADYRFKDVKWTTDWPAEHFDFYACQITHQGKHYSAFIYQPKAETKVGHFQPNNVVELIAPFIAGLSYGDELELLING
ncbi:hypothetical protein DXX93_10550 [Thalassotalea euphylliae]|uniref:Uncharacterized protein n=1 Tax=Thalassotalea euphylliae TaxID=1655234 RepID=A0A3E0TQZ2_9GAMM|nr:hypothetical protein [Thalassotalea euphylliae]REL26969.1 hypothetical protein DXX93_10550 [Thalassotalea euphylliae]